MSEAGYGEAVLQAIALLDQGQLRVAEKTAEGWRVNASVKEALPPIRL